MKGSYEFGKENGSKMFGMKGLKEVEKEKGLKILNKIWDKGFKEFGKENGLNMLFKHLELRV